MPRKADRTVPERDDGIIADIEVKAGATVKSGDFTGLRALCDATRRDILSYRTITCPGIDSFNPIAL